MYHSRSATAVMIVLVAGCFAAPATAMDDSGKEKAEGFVSLLDGSSLDGWQGATEHWAAEDGKLVYKAAKKARSSRDLLGLKLMSAKQYSDFILRFEFKLERDSNNGVAIRAPLDGDPAFVGMEIQVIDTPGWKNRLKPYQVHGSIYGVASAKTGHLKPVGQWNSQEIMCHGRHVKVTLNGTVIVDADLDKIGDKTIDGRKHPGLGRTKGYIGFLGHTGRVEFRKIRVKDLSHGDGRNKGSSLQVFPGKTWESKTPTEVAMDADKLKAFSQFVGGRGCVVRQGCMVFAWGDTSRRGGIASANKVFHAHFLLKALGEKRITSLDEKVVRWEPRLGDINQRLGNKDRNITWRDMVNQCSCYGVAEAPGTAYDYSGYQIALFSDALYGKVYQVAWNKIDEDLFHPRLTDILQCEDRPTMLAFGLRDRAGRVAISPRDFARFGLLYLRKGNWNGKQLISKKHAELAVTSPLPNAIPRSSGKEAEMISGQRTDGGSKNQTDHLGSYSFTWWINGVDRDGKRHWPDAPVDAYAASGHGGPRVLVVIPSLDLIASWNDAKVRGRKMKNDALKLLVDAAASKQ